ncbi:MAG: DNA repair protein RecN [Thermodesulfobacteriota bacterium]
MLAQLNISNLAIIADLEVAFRPGLNILSGETGAGKSIIINAVNLILGGRASAEHIRSGADEARVEALFTIPGRSAVNDLLQSHGLPCQEELVIRRVLSREGRNRITVNGSLATLNLLSRIGQMLISISGQHENQTLLKPENHLSLLDDFGGLTEERLELGEIFHRCRSLREKARGMEREIREGEARQELNRFQIEEIEKARLQPGEDALLEAERKRLLHGEQIMAMVKEAYQALYEKDGAVLSEVARCRKGMEKGAELDPDIRTLVEMLDSAAAQVEEAALRLRELQERAFHDPRRLEEVEDRLQGLNRLKRKYGPTLQDVMRCLDRLSGQVDELDQKRQNLARLLAETEGLERDMHARASRLSRKRKEAARVFEKAVMKELALLAMAGTRFEVGFQEDRCMAGETPRDGTAELRPEGYDQVEFLLSTNVGEPLKPLSRIASGGELSRIMLGLKTILARSGSVETVIFDEVDSGIGGAVAEVVGEKLRSLAAYHQILCITHLPQIAGKGNVHFLVKKAVTGRRTSTTISELTPEERVSEIARLLAGKTVSEKAIAHAREILSS